MRFFKIKIKLENNLNIIVFLDINLKINILTYKLAKNVGAKIFSNLKKPCTQPKLLFYNKK